MSLSPLGHALILYVAVGLLVVVLLLYLVTMLLDLDATGVNWAAVVLLAGPGCVCCGDKGYAIANETGAQCEVPVCQRNQVYVFAVGGMNPAAVMALDSFREDLNRQGFAKVGTGQSIHAWWMARQMWATDAALVMSPAAAPVGDPSGVPLELP